MSRPSTGPDSGRRNCLGFVVDVTLGSVVATIGTLPEGIDPTGVASALTVDTPLERGAVVTVDGFEIVASILRDGGRLTVERVGRTVVA